MIRFIKSLRRFIPITRYIQKRRIDLICLRAVSYLSIRDDAEAELHVVSESGLTVAISTAAGTEVNPSHIRKTALKYLLADGLVHVKVLSYKSDVINYLETEAFFSIYLERVDIWTPFTGREQNAVNCDPLFGLRPLQLMAVYSGLMR